MNMSDFIDTISLNAENFHTLGEDGYVNYVSEYFKEQMAGLSIYERPIHCEIIHKNNTIVKEEEIEFEQDNTKIHIRENDQWTNESLESPLLHTLMLDINDKIAKDYERKIDKKQKKIEIQLKRGIRENVGSEIWKMVLEDVIITPLQLPFHL